MSSETDASNLIYVLKSHYSYLVMIFAIIVSYIVYIYLHTGDQDPNYKCNLKVLTSSSIVAFSSLIHISPLPPVGLHLST